MMSDIAQPTAVPAAQPAAPAPAADVISPAEAKFWQEWAQKAPAIIRSEDFDKTLGTVHRYFGIAQWGSVALGAALGIATFTKHIPAGKWKWASGLTSITSLAFGGLMAASRSKSEDVQHGFLNYADALEKHPELREKLADFLSKTVTAEQIQAGGIENAVHDQVFEFSLHTASHARPPLQGRVAR